MLAKTLSLKGLTRLLAVSLASLLAFSAPLASAATFTVSNLNDAGAGSIRQAIIDANGNAGDDSIAFNDLNGAVDLQSDLPGITENALIDASTATNFTLNGTGESYCLQVNGGNNVLTNQIKGINLTNCVNGIQVTASTTGLVIGGVNVADDVVITNTGSMGIDVNGGDNINIINTTVDNAGGPGIKVRNTADNITIGGDGVNDTVIVTNSTNDGIDIESSANTTITGSFIGTSDGNADNGNGGNGILVGPTVTNLTIGGSGAGQGNVISGNASNGIFLAQSGGATIQGNFIGTNGGGTAALTNDQSGIRVESIDNTIGGTSSGTGNVISGNTQDGIRIDAGGNPASGNVIKNNIIGTNLAGTAAIANGGSGINLSGGTVQNTVIGGDSVGNLISGNTGDGVSIFGNGSTGNILEGNIIGFASDTNTALANGGHGVNTQGDSTRIGNSTGASGLINYIGGNTSWGISVNGADNVLIYNNYIGLASDGTTLRPNGFGGIRVRSTASSTQIGGANIAKRNKIHAGSLKTAIQIENTAGNFNLVGRNFFVEPYGLEVSVTGAANEGMTAPNIATASSSGVSGTAPANANVDLYVNGQYHSSVTADAFGNFEQHAYFSGTKVTAIATNANNSSSPSSFSVGIVPDVTAPTVPVMTSSTSLTNNANYTVAGTKEAYSSVKNNNVEIVAIDALTTFSAGITLVEGENIISLTSLDYSNNESSAGAYSVTLDSTAPNPPSLSYSSSTTSGTVEITGTNGETGVSIYKDGVDTGIDVDAFGGFNLNLGIAVGANSFSFTYVDAAGNVSSATTANITRSEGGGGGGGGGGSSSGSSSSGSSSSGDTSSDTSDITTDQTTDVTIDQPADQTIEESMSGESEADQTLVEEPVNEPVEVIVDQPAEETVDQPIIQSPPPVLTPIQPSQDTQVDTENPKELEQKAPEYTPEKLVKDVYVNSPTGKFLEEIAKENPDLVDANGDNIDDHVEEFFFGDTKTGDDSDNDGVSDIDELAAGLDPTSFDSDGDGIADKNDANPTKFNQLVVELAAADTDTDGDGMSDALERALGTNPDEADSDGDGLKDGDELINYGTDPSVSNTHQDIEQPRISNIKQNETLAAGPQLFSGSTKPGSKVDVYAKMPNGEVKKIAEAEADENGKYIAFADELEEGEFAIQIVSKDENGEEKKSGFKSVSVQNAPAAPYEVKPLVPAEPIDLTREKTISISLAALEGASEDQKLQIVAHIQSTVFSQTLIADASTSSELALNIPDALPPGEHTVSLYAVNLETGQKTEAQQMNFSVTNTAFASGQAEAGTTPWGIVGGSVIALLSLLGLGYAFNKRHHKK